jgi:hypothetical protein
VPRCLDARPPSPPAHRLRTRPRRAFNVFLGATLLSVAGDGITQIGVPWFVLTSTGSPAKAGVVALCTMVPAAVGSLLGGTVVDRGGAWRVSVVSDAACCVVVMTVPVLQLTGALHFWELCALMALAGLLHTPGNTARAVLLPALASRSHLPLSRAAGLSAGARPGCEHHRLGRWRCARYRPGRGKRALRRRGDIRGIRRPHRGRDTQTKSGPGGTSAPC